MYQYTNRDIIQYLYSPENNISCDKQDNPGSNNISSDITLREFFDFLSCACKAALDLDEKHYKELLNNGFVTKLLEMCVDKFKLNVELDGGSISEVYSLDREGFQDSSLFCTTYEEQKQMHLGIRSLLIRINRKCDDQSFSFSHLPILEAENILKHKLEDVINEGVLDSMFPFLISKFNLSANSKGVDNFTLPSENQKSNKHSNKQKTRKSQDSEYV